MIEGAKKAEAKPNAMLPLSVSRKRARCRAPRRLFRPHRPPLPPRSDLVILSPSAISLALSLRTPEHLKKSVAKISCTHAICRSRVTHMVPRGWFAGIVAPTPISCFVKNQQLRAQLLGRESPCLEVGLTFELSTPVFG